MLCFEFVELGLGWWISFVGVSACGICFVFVFKIVSVD